MKNKIFAATSGAAVLFIWGFLSWAVIPWHDSYAEKLTNEQEVIQVLKKNSGKNGVYYLPQNESEEMNAKIDFFGFLYLMPMGIEFSMGKMMAIGYIGNVLALVILILVFAQFGKISFKEIVKVTLLIGLLIGFFNGFTLWNWFHFPMSYFIVNLADIVIGMGLAALPFGYFLAKEG